MPAVRLSFCPYTEAADVPNVVVDGSPTPATTLTLSHWPGTPVGVAELRDDLSAQMAFRYLDHPDPLHGAAGVVTNNHFDQDGLVAAFALVDPDAALARRDVLEDLAAAGDFGTYRFREAARASMVVSAFTESERSPFGSLPADYPEATALLYREVLPLVPRLVDEVDRYRDLWAEEDAALTQSEAAIVGGSVSIVEHPDVDLAVVGVPARRGWSGHRFGGESYDGIHPMALHNATAAGAVLLVADGSYRFSYRYESWVQYRSRRIRPRVDLGPLARRLSDADSVAWSADLVDALTPELTPVGGGSSLAPEVVLEAVLEHLRHAPPAFDPYAGG